MSPALTHIGRHATNVRTITTNPPMRVCFSTNAVVGELSRERRHLPDRQRPLGSYSVRHAPVHDESLSHHMFAGQIGQAFPTSE
jgi:hypothetical protein